MASLRYSYEGAREALSYRVIYGAGRSINIADIAPKGQELSMQPEDIDMNGVFKAIHIGVREDIEHAVLSLVNELMQITLNIAITDTIIGTILLFFNQIILWSSHGNFHHIHLHHQPDINYCNSL